MRVTICSVLISESMAKDFFVLFCKIISSLRIASSCLITFSHVDLQQMHMHLIRHFLGAYWGTKSETNTVKRFSQMFLTANSTTTFFFAKDASIIMRVAKDFSIIMRVALTGVLRADRARAVSSVRPRLGYERVSNSAHRVMVKSLCRHDNQRYPLRLEN
jgi:hypothetical protein